MDEKDFEQIAKRERELAEAEIARMEQDIKRAGEELDAQQKTIMERVIDDNLEEHNAKRSTIWIFAILVVILAGSYFSLTVSKPAANYKKAVKMLESGNYDNARSLFIKLGDYKDSAEMVKECDYRKGNALIASGKYSTALTALANVRGYKERDAVIAELAGTAVQTIATGKNHSAFVRSIGTVKSVGDNSAGQCNTESWKDIVEVACGADYTMGRTSDGKVLLTNGTCDWNDITQIAAGNGFYAGLDSNGTVHISSGANTMQIDGIRDITACGEIFAGLRNDGGVVASGSGLDLSAWNGLSEVATDGVHLYGLKNDGTVLSADGRLAGVSDIRHIYAADNTLIAVAYDQTVYTDGELAGEDFENMLMFSGAEDHCILLCDDGYVKFFGIAESGDDNVKDWTDILFRPKVK